MSKETDGESLGNRKSSFCLHFSGDMQSNLIQDLLHQFMIAIGVHRIVD
jgi:hypothetical protein